MATPVNDSPATSSAVYQEIAAAAEEAAKGAAAASGDTSDADHPGSDYYVNEVTGTIQQQSNPVAGAAMLAAGYIGPFDWSTAKEIADNATADAALHAAGSWEDAVSEAIAPFEDIGKIFHALDEKAFWLRAAKVTVGAVLLVVGVAHLTGAPKVVKQAAKTAAKVGEVAAIA